MHIKSLTSRPRVQVQVVTYNSLELIRKCLNSVLRQTSPIERIVVIDNGSTDGCVDLFDVEFSGVVVIRNSTNEGYAAGHNTGFRMAIRDGMDYVLTLNPDVELAPQYIGELIRQLEDDRRIGGVTGKLLRQNSDASGRRIIDSTGLIMSHFFHVVDRDADASDVGQRSSVDIVWGVCGAAALYNVEMIRDLLCCEEVFDEAFFIYKEDVDLCWRAQRRSWIFAFVPYAVALHDRSWTRDRKMSITVASHSFANQIALLIRHSSGMSVMLFCSILVEVGRFLVLLFSRPVLAGRALWLVHRSWNHHWRERYRLRAEDYGEQRAVRGMSHSSRL